jgi:hypothetical protein
MVDPSSNPHRLVPQGWWLYQARRVNTSGGAGALVTRVSMNAGQVGLLVHAYAQGPASAGADLTFDLRDEDGAFAGLLAYCAAGANRAMNIPSIGSAATASTNVDDTAKMMFAPGEMIRFAASTSLVTETLTVAVTLLLSTPTLPVWDITGSVGGSALGDSSISAANELQKVDLPW